jgi:hypothetical protein
MGIKELWKKISYVEVKKDMSYYMRLCDGEKDPTRWSNLWADFTYIFFWRPFGKYGIIVSAYWKVKYFFQKMFRKNHTSDYEEFELFSVLAKYILPKLKAFRASNIHGYPTVFGDWGSEGDPKYGGMGITKAQYERDKKKGIYVGGGQEAWLKVLDEMIFAFESLSYDGIDSKKSLAFLKKYKLPNPFLEVPENKHPSYYYKSVDSNNFMMSGEPIKEKDKSKYTFLGQDFHYHNYEVEKQIHERRQKGFELFGKHFQSLWD